LAEIVVFLRRLLIGEGGVILSNIFDIDEFRDRFTKENGWQDASRDTGKCGTCKKHSADLASGEAGEAKEHCRHKNIAAVKCLEVGRQAQTV
jgi:hypothetical protein